MLGAFNIIFYFSFLFMEKSDHVKILPSDCKLCKETDDLFVSEFLVTSTVVLFLQ